MRNLFFIVITLGTLCSCKHVAKQQPVQTPLNPNTQTLKAPEKKSDDTLVLNKIVENIIYDLNNDGVKDTISLSQDTAEKNPNWFNRMTLVVSGQKQQIFRNRDAWGLVDTAFLKKNKNVVKSNWVYVYKDSSQSIVLLFGLMYGAGRAKSSALQIKDGKIKMVFDKEFDFISTLSDLDNDGVVEIAVKSFSEMYEQTNSAQINTYDPYFVYSLTDSSKLNIELTQKYNEENYVWAGLHPKKTVKVRYPLDGSKPSVVK